MKLCISFSYKEIKKISNYRVINKQNLIHARELIKKQMNYRSYFALL
jgi:hypothetical protein